jgi:predicted MPP superfamily phosphohydrolase
MSEVGRIAVFLIIVLGVWTLLHAYVVWRVWSVPLVAENLSRRAVLAVVALLWLTYPLGRLLDRRGLELLAYPLEFVGAVWMGALFLLFVALLLADLVSVALVWLPEAAPWIRLGAAALVVLLTVVGVVQFLRGPTVVEHEVRLAGLPPERDGTVLVQVSDLHLGSLLGERWLTARLAQVAALEPDLVAVVGDLVDGNAAHVERLLPRLRELRAPLGVWAVTGNHEYYAGLEQSVKLLEDAGFRVLRDRAEEASPGLVIAGIDDLTARQQFSVKGTPLETALAGRPAGATVLLSHTPWEAEKAAALGVGLMLSGHTHDGQIWPFNYLVALRYPFVGGAYDIGAMRLVVCRGTGTWGPPLRLWRRSEIVKITLRSAA